MNDESAIKFLKEEKEVKEFQDFRNSYYGQGNKSAGLEHLHNSSSTGVTKEYVNQRIADTIGALLPKLLVVLEGRVNND